MRVVLAIVIFALGALETEAAEFHLKDGSVIVGSIVTLIDGEDLVVDTAYMDKVTIEWEAIKEIHGTQVVDVVTYDDRRFIGTVMFDQGNVTISGENEIDVAPADVFSIDEVNDTFWNSVEAYTDLGMNIVRGNNQVTQVSFGGGLGYEGRNFETSVDVSQITNEQTDSTDTRRTTFAASYAHDISPRWQANGIYQFESDEQQGLESRELLGAYLSNRLVNNRRQRFDIYGGVALNVEDFEGQAQTNTPEGILGVAYRLRWATDIDARLTFFPNLEESDRLRAQFDGTLSFDLFSDLDFKITVYNRYDSAPPEGNEKTDTGVTMNLSWQY
jgi:putative salt-induced outer membrane protein YdiY